VRGGANTVPDQTFGVAPVSPLRRWPKAKYERGATTLGCIERFLGQSDRLGGTLFWSIGTKEP
jgi:hypothetical protein